MPRILVTGGCGYIGSHTLIHLIDNGYDVVCVDSNIRSNEHILKSIEQITGKAVRHYKIDLCHLASVLELFQQEDQFDGIIHFAAFKSVPESVANPLRYYHNNLNALLNILHAVQQFKVSSFIFSSSCSVYGNTKALPVREDTPFEKAESPYAHTKQISEQIIEAFSQAHPDINCILLRYFNPGGAHPSGRIGEIPQKGAYNVIPIMIDALEGKGPGFSVTGTDHPTRDGSCIRDYIHVMDVAAAHTLSLEYLMEHKNQLNCEIFNIGNGEGVSVLELITAFNQATGQNLAYKIGPRRAGDVSAIYADAQKSQALLGWKTKYSVNDILSSAWKWHLFRQQQELDNFKS